MEIKDKSGAENVVADHLSRLELSEKGCEIPIDNYFKGEQLLQVQALAPWYAAYCHLILPTSRRKSFSQTSSTTIGKNLCYTRDVKMD